MKKILFSLLAFACMHAMAHAQKAYVLPSPTDANSELTLFIDMNQSEDGIQNNGLSAILDASRTRRFTCGLGTPPVLRLAMAIGTTAPITNN